MKRTILFVTLALCAIALVSAQGNNRWGPGFAPGGPCYQQPRQQNWGRGYQQREFTPPEATSVTGNLTIARGMLAVTSNNSTYLVRGLNRYIGFIDGFKEGAAVTLEGYARNSPQDSAVKFLEVQKMTFNGKDYDLARPSRNTRPNPAPYPQNQQKPRRK
jgi:hypothetical protein